MEQFDLLKHVVATLERLGIRYFITGSFATIFYGEFRTTRDIDIVADIHLGDVAAVCASFPQPEFYISDDAVRDAVATRFQFNILHIPTGLKIDVMLPQRDPHDMGRFERARRAEAGEGLLANFSSPEDIILKKMEFYREGGSDKHLTDIAGVLRISGATLDYPFIARRAVQLRLEDIWAALLKRVKESP